MCCGKPAHLVIFNSISENNFVRGLIAGGERYWIGLNDVQVEGNYTWISLSYPEQPAFRNWFGSEPHNAGSDCVTMRVSNGRWDNQACNDREDGYIIEYDCD
jgi:hypothetical protein